MRLQFFPALAVAAVLFSAVPATATDNSSLSAFVHSCAQDTNGCRTFTLNAILSARSAKYGCIPAELSNDEAAEKLLNWLKGTASANPKYEKEALSDLVWTGVDEIWPCKK